MTQALSTPRRLTSLVVALACFALAPLASAQQDAGLDAHAETTDAAADADAASVDDAEADAGRVWTSCSEHVPPGAVRPAMTESVPDRALSGHAIPVRLTIEHGRGETVFPQGLHIQADSETARVIAEQGFFTPSPDGGSGPVIATRTVGERSVTEVTLHYVALPPKPGRHALVLPPLPIAVARASGDLVTLCTQPHSIVIDDPIASSPDAMPRPNPPPRPQRELWTLARDVTYGLLIGATVAALITWLVLRWMRRPRPPAPPPPPRPPWETALEELASIRRAGLVAKGQLTEHVDLVSDAVRRYLGGRYGFDGIESTTAETLRVLKAERPPVPGFEEIRVMLSECDLVKFARLTPTATDCELLLSRAEQLVRDTMLSRAPGRTDRDHVANVEPVRAEPKTAPPESKAVVPASKPDPEEPGSKHETPAPAPEEDGSTPGEDRK